MIGARKDESNGGAMSRFMQIDIRLMPFYEKPFQKAFPGLARLLAEYEYNTPIEKDVALYHLIDYLDDMFHEPRIPRDVKDKLQERVRRLTRLKATAREQLLGRHLNDLDKTLYLIEDEFVELEKSL
jgi:hypothetical protein